MQLRGDLLSVTFAVLGVAAWAAAAGNVLENGSFEAGRDGNGQVKLKAVAAKAQATKKG